MLNALRLKQGFDESLFSSRTGKPLSLIRDKLNQAKGLELLRQHGTHLRPTQKGYDFLNDLQGLFL